MTHRRVSKKAYDKAVDRYRKEGEAVNECLYQLCIHFPKHRDLNGVHAKVWLIGRTYGTGFERQTVHKHKNKNRQGNVLRHLSRFLHRHRKHIDAGISTLDRSSATLDLAKLERIAVVHHCILKIVSDFPMLRERKDRKKHAARSFVSKYLHMHCPSVPILDSFAKRELGKHHLSVVEAEMPNSVDPEYWKFGMRFLALYERAHRDVGNRLKVKHLDEYLMAPTR